MDDRSLLRHPPGANHLRDRTLGAMTRQPAAHAEREPLPVDASALPQLDPDARRVLDAGLAALSLDLSPGVLAAIDAQMRLLDAELASHRQRAWVDVVIDAPVPTLV